MATRDESERLLQRVTRDLQAPIALLVAEHPRRSVVAHRGFDAAVERRELLAVDPAEIRCIGSHSSECPGTSSWAATAVRHDGVVVGTLFVADRRRRWFDDEEVRHLGLMSFLAGPLIAELTELDLDAIDVRESERSASLA